MLSKQKIDTDDFKPNDTNRTNFQDRTRKHFTHHLEATMQGIPRTPTSESGGESGKTMWNVIEKLTLHHMQSPESKDDAWNQQMLNMINLVNTKIEASFMDDINAPRVAAFKFGQQQLRQMEQEDTDERLKLQREGTNKKLELQREENKKMDEMLQGFAEQRLNQLSPQFSRLRIGSNHENVLQIKSGQEDEQEDGNHHQIESGQHGEIPSPSEFHAPGDESEDESEANHTAALFVSNNVQGGTSLL